MGFVGKWCFLVLLIFLSCKKHDKSTRVFIFTKDSYARDSIVELNHYTIPSRIPGITGIITNISTGKIRPSQITAFAQSLEGIRYKYGSTDPTEGFDCSGFITYVFNHFGIAVPRRSVDFTFAGHEIALNKAKPGDLILFTGTDYSNRIVGHMGIILSSPGEEPRFIHSTSGKSWGVTVTTLEPYYMERYVKTIRVFPTPVPYRY